MPTWYADDPETFTPPSGRSSATLVVLSEDLSGEELTALVGLPADERWNRGDKGYAAGRYAGYKLRSRLPGPASPAEHLTDLFHLIEPVAPRVRALVDDARVSSVRLWLGHHIPNWNPGLSISPEHVRQLHDLGVGLEIDIYVTYGEVEATPAGDTSAH